MANEPYKPVPQPIRPAPAPPENIPTSAAQFGGLMATAAERLGQGLERAGETGEDYALRQQSLFNEAAVNDAQNVWLKKATDLLYRPASSEGANDGGFYTKRGDNALAARADAEKALQDSRTDARAALANPYQQKIFDQLTRRTYALYLGDMGRHVDREIQQAADIKTESALQAFGQQANLAAQSGNMEMFDEAISQGRGATKSWGRLKGFGDDWGDQYSRRFVGQTVANAAEQMAAAGKVQDAAKLVDRYSDQMDKAMLLGVKTKLKGVFEDDAANTWARNAMWGNADNTPDIQSIAGKIGQIEGVGKNPASSAEGVGQFTKSTWLDTVRQTRPDLRDKTDEQVLAMRNDPQFATAITANYAAQNAQVLQSAGLPTTPGNIYLSHFLGPAAAVKALSSSPDTPIASVVSSDALKSNPFLQGKTVGQISQWADTQMAGVGPASAAKRDKAALVAQATTAFANDPAMQRKTIEALNRNFTSIQLQAAAEAAAKKEAEDNAYTQATQQIVKAKGNVNLQSLAGLGLSGEHLERLYDFAQKVAKDNLGEGEKNFGAGYTKAHQAVISGQLTSQAQLIALATDQPTRPPQFDVQHAQGMTAPGNLDPWNRPVLHNPDGSYSTTSSMSIGTAKGEVLIPTVVNGVRLSNEDAIAHFDKTGENLGTFDTPEHADAYATALHNAQASLYDEKGNRQMSTATLTPAGYENLSRALTEKQRGGLSAEAVMRLKQGAYDDAKRQISFEMEVGNFKLADPEGVHRYDNGFLPTFETEYQKGLDAGKTPAQLLTKGTDKKPNPDYIVDRIASQFKRTPAEIAADMANASVDMPGGAGPTDLSTQPAIVKAYRDGKISRDQAATALSRIGVVFSSGEPRPPIAGGP